jgi:hypothetical protein
MPAFHYSPSHLASFAQATNHRFEGHAIKKRSIQMTKKNG